MINEVKAFCERLGIGFNEELVPYYEKGTAMFEKEGYRAVDRERIVKLNNKYDFFRKWLDDVLSAADMIAQDHDLMIHVYTLAAIIKEDADIKILGLPDRQRLDTDFLPMFSLLYFLEEMIERMEKLGLPYKVISDTLQGFDAEINDYYGLFNRSGMRIYVGWFLLFVKGKLIRIGRLNFEMTTLNEKIRAYKKGDDIKILIDGQYMHEKGMVFGSEGQTDESGKYYADIVEDGDTVTGYACNEYGECVREKVTLQGYEEILRYGDKVINVHIPANEPFNAQLCEESYANARKIFDKYFPEHKYKAFCCFSWMLEKRLKQIMGRDTNITLFADKFSGFPIRSGKEGCMTYLYHTKGKVDIGELPENNSMQRAVKKYFLDGNIYYEKGGLFL